MTHEYQGGIEVLVVLLNVGRIVLGRLSLVHRIEVEPRIVVLDGLEKHPKGILETTISQWSARQTMWSVELTTLDQSANMGAPFRSFRTV